VLLSEWLRITLQMPLLVAPLVLATLAGLVVGGVYVYRRQRTLTRMLSAQVESLESRLAQCVEQEAQWSFAREAYHQFVHNLSHEVANPLQSIQTNLDNLASYSPDDPDHWRQHLQMIATEVQRLGSLTESLRLLSHLQTSDAPIVREPVNLKAVTEDVIMALYEASEERSVNLSYVGPQRLGRVLGNREHLRRVLLNLVDNGIKYSRPEGGNVIISVQEGPERLGIRISDDGLGIAKEDLPYIFELAYRAPDARVFRRRGSGLGLAIAKGIVEQHGGQIRVRSQLGEGTTFSFDLPLYVPPEPQAS
jgi:two-component system phosphate regulon sensor histidine kinase PhoR